MVSVFSNYNQNQNSFVKLWSILLHNQAHSYISYLINQTLRHKFFTEPGSYSLSLAQDFVGVYFRVSVILGQHFMAKRLRTSGDCFAGTSNLESNYRLLIRILSYIYL